MPVPALPHTHRGRLDLQVLAEVAALSTRDEELPETLSAVAAVIRDAFGLPGIAVFERAGGDFVRTVVAGPARLWPVHRLAVAAVADALRASGGLFLAEPIAPDHEASAPPVASVPSRRRPSRARKPLHPAASTAEGLFVAALPIHAGEPEPWGLLAAIGDEERRIAPADLQILSTAAAQLGVAVSRSQLRDGLVRQLRKSEALRTIATDISSKLDLDQILSGLVDYALVLFKGDRAAVFLRQPDETLKAEVSRSLSETYRASMRVLPSRSLAAEAIAQRRPLYAAGYAADPRSEAVRESVVSEGFDTICSAPLYDAGGLLGLLNLYHDERHEWMPDELDALSALATQASVAIRTAQNYEQMATWAAQLQSIQQLGTRLSRLTTVQEIASAIASELRQLIDYQNVRVYRVVDGSSLVAVAHHGDSSLYPEETPENLEVRFGQGITGWVAEHGVAQYLPDAARDPRTEVIPGTEEEVPESMLVAPMVFEGQVLGVLVLSKLGVHQFGDDDLRLLVIYAMFAAQAMANADVAERLRAQTELLEHQLRGQRELLQITESILSSLDARAIVEQITDRLFALVRYDRIAVELGDESNGPPEVVATRENRPEPSGLERPPSVLEVPLRSLGHVTGRLRLTRFGDEPPFGGLDVELVRLFAAHASIALQNAEVHHEVEVRARTDDLTGLLNQGTFAGFLRRSVEAGEPFSLIMLDLDDFKTINDRMGHQAGDALLQQIAAAVVGAARDSDVVFRYGGDELAALLPRTESDGARQVAERIRDALRAVRVGRRSRDPRQERPGLGITASIGIAAFPDDGLTPDEVLLAADRACYVAKRNGRDRIASAEEGRALAEEFTLQAPTPVDSPTLRRRG